MNNQPDKPNLNQTKRGADKSKRKSEQDKELAKASRLLVLQTIVTAVGLTVMLVLTDFREYIEPMVLVNNTLLLLAAEIAITLVSMMLHRYCKSHSTFGTLETAFTRILNKTRKQLALKNTHQISPALQDFLYIVLRRNRDTLGLDPGPDVRALSPNGRQVVFRNNTAYYIFKLILPAPPDQDISVLKLLLNQFITAEINNYGIMNLSNQFTSPFNGGAYQSVYLDRLTYDEVRHILVFEILFVGSRTAADALTKALNRDKPKPAPSVPDIFDDEI